LRTLVDQVLKKRDPSHPYFDALSNQDFRFDDFVEGQVQFFWAVSHFHKPMSLLAKRIPAHRNRHLVYENVQDELGTESQNDSHEQSFLQFLSLLARIDEKTVHARPIWSEIHAFNATIDQVCSTGDFRKAAAFMGMIELLFSDYSGRIGKAVIEAEWLTNSELVHYTTHQGLDLQHAKDFFSVTDLDWKSNTDMLLEGLQEGANALDTLYQALHQHRTRRIRQ